MDRAGAVGALPSFRRPGRANLALLPGGAQPGEELLERRRGRRSHIANQRAIGKVDELVLDDADLLQ